METMHASTRMSGRMRLTSGPAILVLSAGRLSLLRRAWHVDVDLADDQVDDDKIGFSRLRSRAAATIFRSARGR
jgi:hypothetical protein